jgi:hypothetical protein
MAAGASGGAVGNAGASVAAGAALTGSEAGAAGACAPACEAANASQKHKLNPATRLWYMVISRFCANDFNNW